MRGSRLLLALTIVLPQFLGGGAGIAAWAETTPQPANLSCITERPAPRQVLRDCDKDPVAEPVLKEEPTYDTPSQIPLFQQHDSGGKGGASGSGKGSGHRGRDGAN